MLRGLVPHNLQYMALDHTQPVNNGHCQIKQALVQSLLCEEVVGSLQLKSEITCT
jgi:hypothetical protein